MRLGQVLSVVLFAACEAHAPSVGSRDDPRAVPSSTVPSSTTPVVEPALRVRWLGGPTATLERSGLRVLTDPMLGPREDVAFRLPKHPSSGVLDAPVARYTSPPAFDMQGLTAILISHTHNDHFDATAQRTLPKSLPVVVAKAGADKVRAAGFADVRPLDWSESLTLEHAGTNLKITAVPAHHAHDAGLDSELGRGNGYVLEWRDSRGVCRVYWTGDAVLSDDSRGLAEKYGPIDLLLPHLGGVGGDGGLGLRTMNAAETLGLVERVNPALVIPIHHTTFAHYREPIEALEQRAGEAGLAKSFHFLREGESFDLQRR
ncbi:MAG TPA: MBL fold metallo-hydrolase [Polyangiaceae bacterium]|nr:MBL fold metallo-hydrolase [Polyangiaceae bacterium]